MEFLFFHNFFHVPAFIFVQQGLNSADNEIAVELEFQ